MKKTILFIISVCLMLILCSCGKVSVNRNKAVELVYQYNGTSVDTELSEQESYAIYEMFDGKVLYHDNPSCGFDENVSIRINGRIFCPACDKCCTVKDCSSNQYFSISESERKLLEDIFISYGGKFPCV